MSLKNTISKARQEARAAMQKAYAEGNTEGFYSGLDQMMEAIADDIRQEYEEQVNGLRQELDSRVLTARGVRQLTQEEKNYFEKFIQAAKSSDPRQAVTGLGDALPRTVIDSVFEDLSTNHPLLSRINFIPASGAVEIMVNTNGYEEATWGDLCDEIVKELTAGIKKIPTNLLKLSAFLPVCKAMLDLGPAWIDRFVRETLYEALANGMEAGIVTGDGNKKPIGMTRQVGDDVVVTGGVYPEKDAVAITDLSPATVGGLIASLATTPNGRTRKVRDVIFLVNPVDYYSVVMPATTVMAPDGTYRNDVMPYPMTIIQIPALDEGTAVIGLAEKYVAPIGTAKEGRIEYSDHYRFLEDDRVYLVKAYANGLPVDNNSFQVLDISGLEPLSWSVTALGIPAADAPTTPEGT